LIEAWGGVDRSLRWCWSKLEVMFAEAWWWCVMKLDEVGWWCAMKLNDDEVMWCDVVKQGCVEGWSSLLMFECGWGWRWMPSAKADKVNVRRHTGRPKWWWSKLEGWWEMIGKLKNVELVEEAGWAG
jgi:hypothetical protein